jgi:hypothetical protein
MNQGVTAKSRNPFFQRLAVLYRDFPVRNQSTSGKRRTQEITRDTFMMITIVEIAIAAVIKMANISFGTYRIRECIPCPPCAFPCLPVLFSASHASPPPPFRRLAFTSYIWQTIYTWRCGSQIYFLGYNGGHGKEERTAAAFPDDDLHSCFGKDVRSAGEIGPGRGSPGFVDSQENPRPTLGSPGQEGAKITPRMPFF